MGLIDDPNQVVLITSRYDQKDNIMAAAWWTKTSFKPELYLVSIAKTRYSHTMIKQSGGFIINFMPYSSKEQISLCGTRSGRDLDKFVECEFNKVQGNKIDCPAIKQALAYIECRVTGTVETGDHTIFIGEAVNTKILASGKRILQLNKTFTTTAD